VTRGALEKLAAADAFRSMGMDRRQALWAVRGEAREAALPLFAAADAAEQGAEAPTKLPEMPLSEHVVQDYQTTRLSLKSHPLSFLRPRYAEMRLVTTAEATGLPNGARVQTAGVVLVRQRPGSASGVVFITIEDETGVANLVVWPRVMERFRPVVMASRILAVRGRVQAADNVVHIVADSLIDRSADLNLLSEDHADPLEGTIANSDEVRKPIPPNRQSGHPRNHRVIPSSRDFH
jgi:error-prone DNA polymerase